MDLDTIFLTWYTWRGVLGLRSMRLGSASLARLRVQPPLDVLGNHLPTEANLHGSHGSLCDHFAFRGGHRMRMALKLNWPRVVLMGGGGALLALVLLTVSPTATDVLGQTGPVVTPAPPLPPPGPVFLPQP